MPLYEYQCMKCEKVFEIIQKFSDAPVSVCAECGGDMRKLISNTSFVLKGSGWYATDYAAPKNKGTESPAQKTEKPVSHDTPKDASPESKTGEQVKQETPSSK